MKLAFLIQAHTGEIQLKKLVDTLIDKENDIFLHIDKKSETLYQNIKKIYSNNSKVHILDNRVDVNWSGFSQVLATLSLLSAVRESNKVFDYINFISGQDFPIKPNEEIKTVLHQHKGREFIEYKDIDDYEWRLKIYNLFRENKKNRRLYIRILDNILRYTQKYFIKRKNFEGFKLYTGSSWFTITYNCLCFILDYLDKNPSFIKQFKYTACADEHFFQILILNSEFKKYVVNDNLRYIIWSNGKSSPETLTIKDYDKLKNTDKIFARKFDFEVDREIINKLTEGLVPQKNKGV